jgi:hypothetical protein
MREKLLDYFERKFDENFKGITPREAFEKTTEQLGFEAYSSYESFDSARRSYRKRKKLRK